MPALLALILPALLPVAMDGVRGVIGMFTGGKGARPQNVDEAIRLMEAEAKKLEALANLDKPTGEMSRWVADLRGSFRYVAAGTVLAGSFGLLLSTPDPIQADAALQMIGSVFSFVFGDRVYLNLKSGSK